MDEDERCWGSARVYEAVKRPAGNQQKRTFCPSNGIFADTKVELAFDDVERFLLLTMNMW